MPIVLYQVDSFTSTPFAGNPAGVCLLESEASDVWMQNVAAEMNVAETAFLRRIDDGWSLRWFTPVVEVDLCGHATLASAHILWEKGKERPEARISFHTRSGVLTASQEGDRIALDFPAERVEEKEERLIATALHGAEILWIGRNRMDLLVEIATATQLRELVPDFGRLASIGVRGVIVTSRSDDPHYDFLSRFFGPAVGIDEDPVTGSAHCALAPYWMERLGKSEMTGYQASRRGGVVGVRVEGERVILIGQAVTVMKVQLLVD